jgi:hypothetical protein
VAWAPLALLPARPRRSGGRCSRSAWLRGPQCFAAYAGPRKRANAARRSRGDEAPRSCGRPTALEPPAAAGDDDAPFADGGSRGSHGKALPEVGDATTGESVQQRPCPISFFRFCVTRSSFTSSPRANFSACFITCPLLALLPSSLRSRYRFPQTSARALAFHAHVCDARSSALGRACLSRRPGSLGGATSLAWTTDGPRRLGLWLTVGFADGSVRVYATAAAMAAAATAAAEAAAATAAADKAREPEFPPPLALVAVLHGCDQARRGLRHHAPRFTGRRADTLLPPFFAAVSHAAIPASPTVHK